MKFCITDHISNQIIKHYQVFFLFFWILLFNKMSLVNFLPPFYRDPDILTRMDCSMMSLCFLKFSKQWIVYHLEEILLKIIFCFCSQFRVHIFLWLQPAIIHKIFETNSSFHVKWRIQFPIFQEFFASIENDFFWTKARH